MQLQSQDCNLKALSTRTTPLVTVVRGAARCTPGSWLPFPDCAVARPPPCCVTSFSHALNSAKVTQLGDLAAP